MKNIKSEEQASYTVNKKDIVAEAIALIESRLKKTILDIKSPAEVKDFLVLRMSELEREHFDVLFLNNTHQLIAAETLFKGTIDGASVYPREVLKKALEYNAAALILAHNHPSGNPGPSIADKNITNRLKDACAYVDIRVLDHIIVGGTDTYSFAEKGKI